MPAAVALALVAVLPAFHVALLAAVQGSFSRRIVGRSIAEDARTRLVVDPLDMAIARGESQLDRKMGTFVGAIVEG